MREYVSLDLETTGLEPKKDRIIEIGAAKIRDGEVQETYSLLVDPRIKIPERITDLTGINDRIVEGQPCAEEAVEGLLEFCKELPLLGHNLLFDYSFVKHCAVNMGLTFEKKGMDTLKIARALLPDLESRSLQSCGSIIRFPSRRPTEPWKMPSLHSGFMKDCGQSLRRSLRNCLRPPPLSIKQNARAPSPRRKNVTCRIW